MPDNPLLSATPVYFAPMEGVTNIVFRSAHKRHFSGVDKYFMPFISPARHLTFSSREQYELDPANNAGMPAVVQILTKDASLFNAMARGLADAGYAEANLNLGCPSPTVSTKGKGAGMLRDLPFLERFLDEIFAAPPLRISVKTRVGFESSDEWPELAEIFKRYPISELIVHPRTRRELYSGQPHWECLREIENAPFPVIANGNLFSSRDCENALAANKFLSGVMLGRGMIANPALAGTIKGQKPLDSASLKDFHDDLFDSYSRRWPENAVVGHMHEIMNYTVRCFLNADKQIKAVRKSKTAKDYTLAVKRLFDECPLKDEPYYIT